MDEFEISKTIEFYENLEGDFLEFLKLVPYEEKNKEAWSPKLADIIVGCGSLLDSLFRASMPETHNGRPREDYTINDFRGIFGEVLEPLRTLVYISPPIIIHPYKDWSEHSPPWWWSNYNKVKHNRLKNMRMATIDTAMNSLCGLFEAISQNQKMGAALIRHEWVNLGGYNPDLVVPMLETKTIPEATGSFANSESFLVESKLFVTALGANNFSDDVSKIQPAMYRSQGRARLVAYLGKWMNHQSL